MAETWIETRAGWCEAPTVWLPPSAVGAGVGTCRVLGATGVVEAGGLATGTAGVGALAAASFGGLAMARTLVGVVPFTANGNVTAASASVSARGATGAALSGAVPLVAAAVAEVRATPAQVATMTVTAQAAVPTVMRSDAVAVGLVSAGLTPGGNGCVVASAPLAGCAAIVGDVAAGGDTKVAVPTGCGAITGSAHGMGVSCRTTAVGAMAVVGALANPVLAVTGDVSLVPVTTAGLAFDVRACLGRAQGVAAVPPVRFGAVPSGSGTAFAAGGSGRVGADWHIAGAGAVTIVAGGVSCAAFALSAGRLGATESSRTVMLLRSPITSRIGLRSPVETETS